MTVSSSTNRVIYDGNGVTTAFPFAFKILSLDDLVVRLYDVDGNETVLAIGTDYTVPSSVVGSENGGTVTMLTAPAVGEQLLLRREMELIQPTDFQNQGRFFPETHERAFDRLLMQTQQLSEDNGRSIKVAANNEALEDIPGSAADRAGHFLKFDDDGNPVLSEITDPVLIGANEALALTIDAKNTAVSAAGTATAAAGTATTQAGVATTQAGVATIQAAAALADRVLADADAAATAADRVATAEDRVATGLDRAAVEGILNYTPTRDPVRLATAAPIAAHAYNNAAGTITFSAVGSQSVDGVATALNDRILLAAEPTATLIEQGDYTVTTKGTGGVAEVWTRATDGDTGAELVGSVWRVLEGTDNVGAHIRVSPGLTAITLGTTPITLDRQPGPVAVEAALREAGDAGNAAAVRPIAARIKPLPLNPYGFIHARTDANGYVGFATKADGVPISPPSTALATVQKSLSPITARIKKLPLNPYGYVRATTDANGYVMEATLIDGSQIGGAIDSSGDVISEPMAYMSGADLHVVDSHGDTTIATAFSVVSPVVKRNRIEFLSDMLGGALRKFRMLLDGTFVAVEPDGVVDHILGYGQSNDVGAYAQPLASLSNPYPTRSLMFNGGVTPSDRANHAAVLDVGNASSFVPLAEQILVAGAGTTFGETKASGLCRTIQSSVFAALNTYQQLLYSSSGISGQSYAGLKKGQQPYTNMMACVSQARAIALAAGKKHIVRSIHITHGEADQISSTYQTELAAWQSDISADVLAITGQPMPVHMFIDQYSAWNYVGNTPNLEAAGLKSPFAQDAAAAASAYIHLVCPKYIFTYPDTIKLHLSATSQRLLGAYHAKARKRVLMDGQKWVPLRPILVTRTGGVIDVQFAVPAGPLVLDASLVSDPGNYGFEYFDASGTPPAISSVVLKPGTTDSIRVTLASDPGAAAGKRIRYAFTSVPNAGGGPTTGPRGCLRDSDSAAAEWDGTPLHNYCIHFDIYCP